MNCELYFYQDDTDWKNLDENLTNELSSKLIITNDDDFKIFLNNSGYDAKSLLDIFPNDNSETYKINQQSMIDLKEYSKYFEGIHFRGFEIFSTFETTLRAEFLLVNQIKHILKDKKNYLFIFKTFSFSYFVIQKFFYEKGFSHNKLSIYRLYNGKKLIFNTKSISKLNNLSRKYNFLNTYTKNTSSKISNNLSMNKETFTSKPASKINPKKQKMDKINIVKKILTYKLQNMISPNFEKFILKKIDLKLKKTKCLFFITPSNDYVIKPIYNIFKVFEDHKSSFSIIVFDLQTNSQMVKNGFSTINLFEETYVLSKSLKNNKDVIELKKTIENIINIKNLNLLKIDDSFNPIIDGIFTSLAIMILTEFLLRRTIPSSIACINDGTKIGNSVVSVAKNLKVPTFSIVTLGLTADPMYNIFKSDKICIYGTQGYEILQSFGFLDNQIHVVGNPRYDNLKSIPIKNSKLFLEKIFHIPYNSKLIVLGFTRWHDNDEIWISDFIKFCNSYNYELFIKIHPIYKNTLKKIHEKKLEIIKKNCPNENFHISIDIDLSTLLSASNLIITDHSNLGFESILLNKPVINVNFNKSDSKGFELFQNLDLMFTITNISL